MDAVSTPSEFSSPYGEENSLGVETASILHRNIREMLEELNKN